MPIYYLDSTGLHAYPNIAQFWRLPLELGTVIYFNTFSNKYKVVHIKYKDGSWSEQKAHTKDIKRMKTVLLIEGVSFDS